ncbi:MAG: acyl-CoA dehydrogenase family protein, partial [Candidatus Binatia bacterium]
MDFNLTIEQQQIREEIKKVCKEFPDAYWRKVDSEKAYPDAFVKKLGDLGWLAALIPEEFGGTGLGITEASIILEEINHSGGVATACHAQMYTMGTLLRHGNAEQKKRYLPKIATGELLPTAVFTEPNIGSDLASLKTRAVKDGDTYKVTG